MAEMYGFASHNEGSNEFQVCILPHVSASGKFRSIPVTHEYAISCPIMVKSAVNDNTE